MPKTSPWKLSLQSPDRGSAAAGDPWGSARDTKWRAAPGGMSSESPGRSCLMTWFSGPESHSSAVPSMMKCSS